MKDVYKEAVELHKKNQGKLEVKSKIPIRNKKDLSLAYTPGVAEVSRIIAKDKNKSFTYTFRGNTVAVVSDGSAILGLGNLGAEAALPVMEGKCILFKEFANVDAVPICLGTQDTEEIIKTVKFLAPSFGGINLEDISAPRCFEIEERLKKELDIPVMHDDQHGTATVILAALINSLKLIKKSKLKVKIVINGAGAAGIAVTKLLLKYGFKNIVVCDTKGAINKERKDLNKFKKEVANITNKENLNGNLSKVLVGTDIFIGLSAPKILTTEMIKKMSSKPIIFAMANPVPEILPSVALEAGAFIVATGRSDFANQINNVLAFPGIFRGALDNKVKKITDTMLIGAANNLANLVEEPKPDFILPNPFDKNVVKTIARAIK